MLLNRPDLRLPDRSLGEVVEVHLVAGGVREDKLAIGVTSGS